MNDVSTDEHIIKNISQDKLFLGTSEVFSDNILVHFIVQKLETLYKGTPIIVTLTAGPGAGKEVLLSRVIEALQKDGHPSDSVSTDSFGLYTREVRNQLIQEGKLNPWTAKDWELLNIIVDNVRKGNPIKAPEYDEATGNSTVVGKENFPHLIPANLHFFFVEGDFQPIKHADFKIYFHVPTDVRRENRVERDMKKRSGGDPDKIKQSFDYRLQSQYYPYTLPHAQKADILIVTKAEKVEGYTYPYKYTYDVYTRQ